MVLVCRQDCTALHTHDLARSGNGGVLRLMRGNGLFLGCVHAESVSPALHVVGVMFPGGAAKLYALQLVRQSGLSRRGAFLALCCSQERMLAPGFVLRVTERPLSPRVPL